MEGATTAMEGTRRRQTRTEREREWGSRDSAGRAFNGGTAKETAPKEDKEQQTRLSRHNRTQQDKGSNPRPQQEKRRQSSELNSVVS